LDDHALVTMTPRPLRRQARAETSPFRPRIYFIRHGETDWNAEERLLSRTDVPLNRRAAIVEPGRKPLLPRFNIGRPDDLGPPR
jgi:hypothetical protein